MAEEKEEVVPLTEEEIATIVASAPNAEAAAARAKTRTDAARLKTAWENRGKASTTESES